MRFHITQQHSPATCPVAEGVSVNELYDKDAPGVTIESEYADATGHCLYLIVEADDIAAVHTMLKRGLGRATTTITPVVDVESLR